MKKTFLTAVLALIAFMAPQAADYYTVAELIEIYNSLGLATSAVSSDSYTGRGYVTSFIEYNSSYNNANFYIDDRANGSNKLQCYRLTPQTGDDKRALEEGEYVEITAKLQNYNGRPEMVKGTYHVLESQQEEIYGKDGCILAYNGKKGSQILSLLYDEIKDPDTVEYYFLRADKTGIDYRDNGKVWDMYSNCEFASSSYCVNTTADECECYNREHLVPQSYWGNDNTKRMRTDLHNVIPADAVANEKRSAWAFGEVTGSVSWTNGVSKLGKGTYGDNTFEPADEYKGDIARVYFYMLACYPNENFTQKGTGSKVFTYSNGKAGLTSTAKNLFLKWHRNDPVSQKEINRNKGVQKKQGNRNPFVDAPELVEYIWGSKTSQTYVCESTQGIEDVEVAPSATKVLENGQLFIILPDGARYTVIGERVR